jgi:ABC-type glycerol-3-phosphate transport system substrate-binding protein
MKKRLLILTLALLFAGAAQAQIFIEEGDASTRSTTVDVPSWVNNPDHAEAVDHYVPVGNGILCLAALGSAYMLKKRKKI